MDKRNAVDFSRTIDKYGLALCGTLYPSQIDTLQRSLEYYRRNERLPKIEDTFTNLACRMIIADLIWQEKQNRGGDNHE